MSSEEKELWAKVINDARWYDGTPQMLDQLTEHFIKQGIRVNKITSDDVKKNRLGAVMHWVAVSENKPKVGQWLLVYAPSGRHIAWYNGFQFEDIADYNIQGVTHWMQIPEPPCA